MQCEAVMRRAGRFDRLEADETPDTVIDMHDEIASRQARDLGNEIVRALLRTAWPHQPVAENVLLADDGGVCRLEAGLDAEFGQRDLRPRPRQRILPRGNVH